jgi:hypothetical protein
MARKITEVTRRDIRDALSSVNLYGRLEEIDFLSRLYDLDALPSHDGRFRTARDDIAQHRIANDDWDKDWIFDDSRFGLKDGDDQTLLRFLAEILHPAVRTDRNEVDKIAKVLNDLIEPDGYALEVVDYLSGRPIYKPVEVTPRPPSRRVTEKHFTQDVRPLVATARRYAELDGSMLEQEVLRAGEPQLEQPEFDNLDGGTYYYTLTLRVPVEVFARLGDQVRTLEERIAQRIAQLQRAPDRHHVTAVAIQPSMVDPRRVEEVVVARSESPVPQFWAPGQFRLFISHVSSHKQRAEYLRQELSRYHISGFVAHETIEPGKLWQREIEAALRTMQAMAAVITPDFHESKWTDQEIGWALGSGTYVLPIRREADPYGFIGEIQGIQARGKKVHEVADEVFDVLLRETRTRGAMLDALTARFERTDSYREARDNMTLLERAAPLPERLIRRVEVAVRSNDQIADATGVPKRVETLTRTPISP